MVSSSGLEKPFLGKNVYEKNPRVTKDPEWSARAKACLTGVQPLRIPATKVWSSEPLDPY